MLSYTAANIESKQAEMTKLVFFHALWTLGIVYML